MIQLSQLNPVAEGRIRRVYWHPDNNRQLIKVIRPDVIEQRWGARTLQRRFRQYVSYVREVLEYVAVYAKEGRSPSYLQKIVGFVETDLGLGLVLEAVLTEDGRISPTLKSLVIQGNFDGAAELALDRFLVELCASDIIFSELRERNLVYGYSQENGHHFVMIDGIGLSTMIPIKALFPSLNRRSKEKHVARLRERIVALKIAAIPGK